MLDIPDFRGPPQRICSRCASTAGLRQVQVDGKEETLCEAHRVALQAEPVWVDRREYRVTPTNDSAFWSQ